MTEAGRGRRPAADAPLNLSLSQAALPARLLPATWRSCRAVYVCVGRPAGRLGYDIQPRAFVSVRRISPTLRAERRSLRYSFREQRRMDGDGLPITPTSAVPCRFRLVSCGKRSPNGMMMGVRGTADKPGILSPIRLNSKGVAPKKTRAELNRMRTIRDKIRPHFRWGGQGPQNAGRALKRKDFK